jgi:hypothetical protein
MPTSTPHTQISIPEVMTRNATARHMVTGFSAATPALADLWQHVAYALADTGRLAAEVARLSAELAETRLDRANLLAAMRAALAAAGDGEADPLAYLRDELPTPQRPAQARRGQR